MRADRDASGFSNNHAYIGKTDHGLWLYGNGKTGLYAAFEKLLAAMTESDKNIVLEVPSSICEPIKEINLSVMSYNVYFDLSEEKRNPDDVIVSVKQKSPDVFGLNESGKDWIEKFNADAEIKSIYNCAEGKPSENSKDALYNPIFYRKDKFELVQVGTKWLSSPPDKISMYPDAKHYKIFTYAILKDKASGKEFMYINAHLDGSNEGDSQADLGEVRKLQAEVVKSFVDQYTYLPVVMGGDFNEQPTSSVIRGISNNTRFKYCMSVADTKVDLGTTKKVNSKFELLEKGSILDYLFVTGDCISVQKYEQVDNLIDGKYPSDHLPVYAEITIKF